MRKFSNMVAMAGMVLLGACIGAPDDGIGDDASSSTEPITPAPFFAGDPANQAVFASDVSVWETPLAQSQMDCFWDSGVRHVIVGTQQEDVTRQQLAMAVSRGMTVDAYVYLYWDTDMAAQVAEAFKRVSGFPVGRMWLDVEQDPAGRSAKTIDTFIQQSVTACAAQGSVTCGIYTGPGFWKSYTGNTNAFTSVQLWYAQYNGKTSLSSWSTEAFGGWAKPVAKQFATKPLCGVGGADWDVMQVAATPTVTVDRSLPPDDGLAPAAPGGLYPSDGSVVTFDYAKIMSGTVPRATQYQLAVERWTGSAWGTYYTWSNPNAFVKFSPQTPNSIYRFRVRAQNAHGWGAWSAWSAFDYGKVTGPRPSSTPPAPTSTSQPAPTSTSEPPPPQPPTGDVPGMLAPDGGALVSTGSVKLTCSAPQGATSYEFAIESQSGAGYAPYYTYAPAAPSQTFYPQIHGVGYRWRVRAKINGAFGGWSGYATFQFK